MAKDTTLDWRLRAGGFALAIAGILFFLYPAMRPWEDETTVAGAERAMGSGAWVVSHTWAMIGFVLVAPGVVALRGAARDGLGDAAVVVTWLGVGRTLPYYGLEAFGLHSLARAASSASFDLVELAESFRYQPVAITMFGLGLVGLAIGAVLVAVVVQRSDTLPTYAGWLFAAGFVLFLPQFFASPAIRIAHGVLVAAGCSSLGVALTRVATQERGQLPGR